jgi:hypothetical protein
MAKRAKATVTYHAAELPAPGARIGTVDGPCQNPKDRAGTVLFHQADRWGTHAVALMDSGEITQCGPITTVGIGWYLLSSGAVGTY